MGSMRLTGTARAHACQGWSDSYLPLLYLGKADILGLKDFRYFRRVLWITAARQVDVYRRIVIMDQNLVRAFSDSRSIDWTFGLTFPLLLCSASHVFLNSGILWLAVLFVLHR